MSYGLGSGPVVTNPTGVRVAFIAENWTGSLVTHNSWASGHTYEHITSHPIVEGLVSQGGRGYQAGFKELYFRQSSGGPPDRHNIVVFVEVTKV